MDSTKMPMVKDMEVSNNSGNSGEDELPYLPVIGLPGANFYILHITALVSLFISIICSLAVFGILRPKFPAFWMQSSGQRYAIYLAFADILCSVTHSCDHWYMLIIVDHPPEIPCIIMGFFVSYSFYVQSLIISVMAVSAFVLVVKEKKFSLGRYDWKLHSFVFIMPAVLMIPCAAMKWLGPSGAWCVADVRKVMGRWVAYIQNISMLSTMLINLICYLGVWIKIKKISAETESVGASTKKDNSKTSGVLMKFVAAYIFQWIFNVMFYLWSLFAMPPFAMVHIVVFTCNAGGLLNLIAYTLGRRMGNKEKAKKNTTTTTQN